MREVSSGQRVDARSGTEHVDHARAVGQRVEEGAAVGLGQDAGVEDHDDAAVGPGADQPAEALLELDDRLGDLVVDERVAAAAADVLEPGLQQRVARARENGSRVMITFESASPGTSTPCQKLSTPKITLLTSALKASTIFERGMPSLWENSGDVPPGQPGRQRAVAASSILYEVNRTNALPWVRSR